MSKDRLFKEIIKFSLPVMVDQFFVTLLISINLMLCSRAGAATISAVGNVDSIHSTANQVFLALTTGGTVVVARYMGGQDSKKACEAGLQALLSGTLAITLLTLVIWIFRGGILNALFGASEAEIMSISMDYFTISLFSYPLLYYALSGYGILRGLGDTKTPMRLNVLTTVFNVIIGFFLIQGFYIGGERVGGLGAVGAALTLIIVRLFAAVLVTYALADPHRMLRLRMRLSYRPDWSLLKEIYNIGVPTCAESLIFMAGRLLTQSFISTMGTFSIATNNIGNSIMNYMTITSNAFVVVGTTVTGRAAGSGDRELCKKSLRYTMIISWSMVAVSTILLALISPWLCSLYIKDADIIKASVALLWEYALVSILIHALSFVLPSGFRGVGDIRFTFIVAIASMWLCRVFLGYYLGITLAMGVRGIWIAMYCDWALRAALFIWRYKSGRWLKAFDRLAVPGEA